MKIDMTATNIANACSRSAEWVRYNADRGRIPFTWARMGTKGVRIFSKKGLQVAKRLAGETNGKPNP